MELDRTTFAKLAILAWFVMALWGNRDLVMPEPAPPPAPEPVAEAAAPASRSLGASWGPPPVPDGILAALANASGPRVLPEKLADAEQLKRHVSRFGKLGYKTDALVKVLALGAMRRPLEKVWRELTRALDRKEWEQARELAEGALRACDAEDLLTRKALLEQLVQIAKEQGELDRARARADEAARLFEEVNALWGLELKQHPDRVGLLKAKGRDMLDDQAKAAGVYRQELAASIQAAAAKAAPASPRPLPADASQLSQKARDALGRSAPEVRQRFEQWLKERK